MTEAGPGRGWNWMLWGAAAYNWLVSLPVLLSDTTTTEGKISAVLVAGFGLL